jgi:hypothetical protein
VMYLTRRKDLEVRWEENITLAMKILKQWNDGAPPR